MNKNTAKAESKKKVGVFDLINDLSYNKKDLLHDGNSQAINLENTKTYCPVVINRAFSLHLDTLLDAQIMNESFHLWPDLQYDYYLFELRKAKRFSKWNKPITDDVDTAIMSIYNVNKSVAKSYRSTMTSEQLGVITNMAEGGLGE